VKILFSSDLHGDLAAYAAFARRLAVHDAGVLAGDLLDEFIGMDDARAYGLVPDDGLEELPGEDVDEVAAFEEKVRDAIENPGSPNRIGIELNRRRLADILAPAGRPVYFVRGNHDVGEWTDSGVMVNVEDRQVIAGRDTRIVGFRDRFDGVRSIMTPPRELAREVGRGSVVVTHAPPYGVLDVSRVRDPRTGRVRPMHLGSRRLRRLVRWRSPSWCLFGHVHEQFGAAGRFVNGSWPGGRRFVSIDTDAGTLAYLDA
jgi:Icc-related predicted phosphoesterase